MRKYISYEKEMDPSTTGADRKLSPAVKSGTDAI